VGFLANIGQILLILQITSDVKNSPILLSLKLVFHQYYKVCLLLRLGLPLTFRTCKKCICLQVLLGSGGEEAGSKLAWDAVVALESLPPLALSRGVNYPKC